MPYPIARALTQRSRAFEESYAGAMGVDLDVQTTRVYPNGSLAEDVLGYVRQDDSSVQDEDAFFNYRLPDFSGVIGARPPAIKNFTGTPERNWSWSTTGYRRDSKYWKRTRTGR